MTVEYGWRPIVECGISRRQMVAFQTDVNLASTLDPGNLDTPSGDGDLVYRLTVGAGTINLAIEISYHAHAV